MVLPYIKMNPPQVYTCSPSRIPLPPPSPYHPSGSSQCTSPKNPVSCIEPGLEIHFIYDIIHVSMPFSQIVPPSMSSSNCCFLTCIQVSQEARQVVWYAHLFQNFPQFIAIHSAIKKNTFESVLMRWMKLEPIIQSEISQKEKHQYSILTHIYGI